MSDIITATYLSEKIQRKNLRDNGFISFQTCMAHYHEKNIMARDLSMMRVEAAAACCYMLLTMKERHR